MDIWFIVTDLQDVFVETECLLYLKDASWLMRLSFILELYKSKE